MNGIAGHLFRQMIYKQLAIEPLQIYKVVKSIDESGKITTHDGREFIPVLLEITNKK